MDTASLSDADRLATQVHAALRHWHTLGGTPADLLQALLLVQEQRERQPPDDSPAARRLATNAVLLAGLEALKAEQQLEAEVLRLRFLDRHKGLKVASLLNVSRDHINRLQKAGLIGLTQILLRQEAAARARRIEALEAQLDPPQYSELFGVAQARQTLTELAAQAAAPWVIAIVGLGGIGKTALADCVARSVLRQLVYARTVWIRLAGSGHQTTPSQALDTILTVVAQRLCPEQVNGRSPEERRQLARQALKAQPCLVIVDNLETEAETDFLFTHLADLAAPSKFLLTTRARPAGQSRAFVLSLDELPQADALDLLRHHAHEIGCPELAAAATPDLAGVYAITGGNPLALRLVASLATLQPLPKILDDLRQSSPGPVENLYRHIYWKVWNSLSAEARRLLQAMPLLAERGGAPEQLAAISQLAEAQLWPAIRDLAKHSLLEVHGTLNARRYGIHRLTETFLRTEIIDWPEDN